MDDTTKPEANLPKTNIFVHVFRFSYLFPIIFVLVIYAFLGFEHLADPNSPMLDVSMLASVVICLFMSWLEKKRLINIPQNLKHRAAILNLIGYFLFTVFWYLVYMLMQNIIPHDMSPDKLSDSMRLTKGIVLTFGALILFLLFRDFGKQKQKLAVTVPAINQKFITIGAIAVIIVVCLLGFFFPSKSDKYRDKAMPLIRQNDKVGALEYLNKAIQEVDPNCWQRYSYYEDRGYLYGQLGKYNEAIADLTQAISYMQKNKTSNTYHSANLYVNRANDYMKTGQYENAIGDYSDVLNIDKRNGSVYSARGLAYEKLSKHDLAIKDQLKAKELGYESPRSR